MGATGGTALSSTAVNTNFWQLDAKQSTRDDTKKELKLVYKRPRTSPGIANIRAGGKAKAKLFISPSKEAKVFNLFDITLEWSKEFEGEGSGLIVARPKSNTSQSGGFATTFAFALVSLYSALAF